MAQVVRCPTCQTQYQIKDELAGRKAKCKKCSQNFQIPAVKRPRTPEPAAIAAARRHDGNGREPENGAAATDALKRPAKESPEQAMPAKTQCPHCGAWVAPGLKFCGECRLDMDKSYGSTASDRDREMRKNALYSLIGIVATLVAAPVFFLLLALVVGGGLAMLISVLLMQIGVSIGSFSLACQLFKQDPPEPSEILRVVFFANFPAGLLASWLFGGGVVGALGTVAIATIIAALVCMFHVGMPVVPSIFISVAYNVFSGILTFVWIMVLVVVFAGYTMATRPAMPADGLPEPQSSTFREAPAQP